MRKSGLTEEICDLWGAYVAVWRQQGAPEGGWMPEAWEQEVSVLQTDQLWATPSDPLPAGPLSMRYSVSADTTPDLRLYFRVTLLRTQRSRFSHVTSASSSSNTTLRSCRQLALSLNVNSRA
jgi:hypothetical protein